MTSAKIRIATRQSLLALWQAEHVKQLLLYHHPHITVELLPMITQGDKFMGPLNKVGGKGVFIKELEEALLAQKADIAVHSMKDVPVDITPDLELAVICQRADPRDAFVSARYNHFSELPLNARVGTSSLRRQCQLATLRPDLSLLNLRGNVNTRLSKLMQGEFDAIILAAAGLQRLGMEDQIKHYFSTEEMLPAAGQGALGIECRKNDNDILALIQPLNHLPSQIVVNAERKVNRILGGNCQVPIGTHAVLTNNLISINSLVISPETMLTLKSHAIGDMNGALALSEQVANHLLAQGADRILSNLKINHD